MTPLNKGGNAMNILYKTLATLIVITVGHIAIKSHMETKKEIEMRKELKK